MGTMSRTFLMVMAYLNPSQKLARKQVSQFSIFDDKALVWYLVFDDEKTMKQCRRSEMNFFSDLNVILMDLNKVQLRSMDWEEKQAGTGTQFSTCQCANTDYVRQFPFNFPSLNPYLFQNHFASKHKTQEDAHIKPHYLLRQGPLQVATAEQVLPDGPIQEESFEDEDVPGDLVREEEELLSQESYSALK